MEICGEGPMLQWEQRGLNKQNIANIEKIDLKKAEKKIDDVCQNEN